MNLYPSGTRIAGRYEVAGRPLMGGMGIVYLCFDHEEQRPVALKTFRPEFLPDRAARDRFLREGTIWVNLGRHPHIVRAYGVERIGDGRQVYLMLELVAKEHGKTDASLRSWLVPGKPLPVEQGLLFALQIARGMKHTTKVIPGFVHRDLKPENMLVGADRLSNANINRLRVTDFGLAAVLQEIGDNLQVDKQDSHGGKKRTLLTRGVVGTPEYMAPEQWNGHDVDVRADIYALGCILVEMLTGKMPVQAKPRWACRQLHQSGQALQAACDLPKAIVSVLGGCLAANPGGRYESWELVEEALSITYAKVMDKTAPGPMSVPALARAERVADGWSYRAMGASYLDIGKAEVALDYFRRVQEVAKTEGERHLEIAALSDLGLVYNALGDLSRTIRCCEQALAISRELDDWSGQGVALGNLGTAYKNLGEVQRAIECYEQGLMLARQTGDSLGEENMLMGMGIAFADLGNSRRAIEFYNQALVIARQIGDRRGEGNTLGNLGNAYYHLGKVRRAIECYRQQAATAREIGDLRGEGLALSYLGNAYFQLRDFQQAAGFYEQALAISSETGDRRGQGYDLGNLGNVYAELGDARRAIGCHEKVCEIAREIGDQRLEGTALSNLGNAYADLGDMEQAVGSYEQALAVRNEIGDVIGVATVSGNMARLLLQDGELDRALPLAQQAAEIFDYVGQTQFAQQAQQMVTQIQAAIRSQREQMNLVGPAFDAFYRAGSLNEMRSEVAQLPFLADSRFILTMEQFTVHEVPPEHRPIFKQRLAWLRQIASEQKGEKQNQ